MFLLETPRLRLRSFRKDDLSAFFAYRADPEVARLQGWPEPYTLEMAEAFIQEMTSIQEPSPGDWFQVALEEKSSGILAGDAAFKIHGGDHPQAELGMTLAKAYQGRGYGLEAGCRMLAYLFDELKMHRVFANTDVLNQPAYTLLEKLGFRREAHFVENLWFKGRWASEYWYGMLATEWESCKTRNRTDIHID